MSELSKAQAARDKRLGAALRENLKRRRTQARSRKQPSRPDGEKPREPEAGKKDR